MKSKIFGEFPPSIRHRVVVTGLGAVTPLGVGVPDTWANILAGHSGVKRLDTVPHYFPAHLLPTGASAASVTARQQSLLEALPCRVAAPVVDSPLFSPNSREPRSHKFSAYAVREALIDAGLITPDGAPMDGKHTVAVAGVDPSRVGVNIGMGIPSLADIAETSHLMYGDPVATHYKRVNPFFVPKILGNMAAAAAALKYGLQGPIGSSVTACATGAHCIGEGMRWIQHGLADLVVCGATESCITPVSIAGFARMRALSSKFNERPADASRPFDQDRCGFVMGEGAGILVLESLQHAAKRKAARIYAELRGFGLSSDAYHVSSPHPEGRAASACIRAALLDGCVAPNQILYCNAHATGTPLGDEIELDALISSLRPANKDFAVPPLLVSSNKGGLGHLLGAAGSVESAMTVLSLFHRKAPPNVNLEKPIPHDEQRAVLVRNNTIDIDGGDGFAVMSTSFGFGGANAALVFTSI